MVENSSRPHFVNPYKQAHLQNTTCGKSDKTILSVVFARRVDVFSIARGYIGFMKGGWLVNLLSFDDHLFLVGVRFWLMGFVPGFFV